MRDIQDHWAQPCIEYLVQQHILSGYPDGTFRPEKPVTRAEFAAIAVHAFDPPAKRPFRVFRDVDKTHWAIAAITRAYQAGWLSGYPDGTFAPAKLMPKAQALTALAAGLDLLPLRPALTTVKHSLSDAAQIPAYAITGVAAALEHQLVVNYPERDRLHPLSPATRADIAAYIYQALVLQTGVPSLLPPDLIAGSNLPAVNSPVEELRGVWLTNVDSNVLFSRQNLANAVERLSASHINTLYPTVWNGGFTLFPCDVAEEILGERQRLHPGLVRSAQEASQDGRDMLAECIELAHGKDMQVIPWFEYGFFARRGNSLRKTHPDWFTHQRDGTQIDKHTMEWLNPFHPEVQQFFRAMITELLTRYEVDGIQIDDHFGLPVDFGYDPYTTRLYRSETGRLAPSDPHDDHWKRWRADKITRFVAQIAGIVKSKRPTAIVSISPNPPRFSYDNFLQDWPDWILRAEIDQVVVQTYRWTVSSFVNELQKPVMKQLQRQVPISIGVLSGLRNRPMPLPTLKQQCQAVRANGYAGMAFFFYETLWQTAGESPDIRAASLTSLLGGSD